MNMWFIAISQIQAQTCPSIEIISQSPIQNTDLNRISGVVWQERNILGTQ